MPGNLELVPHTLVRELLDEVNRGHEIAGDRDLIRREIEELERYAQAWAKLAGEEEETERARMGEGLGRMAALLSGLADRLKARDQGSKQATDVESAATQVEALAKSMAERRPAEDAVAEALDSARRSLDHQPDEEE